MRKAIENRLGRLEARLVPPVKSVWLVKDGDVITRDGRQLTDEEHRALLDDPATRVHYWEVIYPCPDYDTE